MDYLSLFRMPKPMKITGRSSSITNSFINSIIPVVEPTNEQVKNALNILEMDYDSFQCSYCGEVATEWDHLRPLVMNRMPTGYVSEINNLVPACGKCNQSKGNKDWKDWIMSDATLSPHTKGVSDITKRIKRLDRYESSATPTKVDFESLVGKAKWDQHWKNWEVVQEAMREAQVLATEINMIVAQSYAKP
jgi:hypothetical protein